MVSFGMFNSDFFLDIRILNVFYFESFSGHWEMAFHAATSEVVQITLSKEFLRKKWPLFELWIFGSRRCKVNSF
jgi:hypothetical protein